MNLMLKLILLVVVALMVSGAQSRPSNKYSPKTFGSSEANQAYEQFIKFQGDKPSLKTEASALKLLSICKITEKCPVELAQYYLLQTKDQLKGKSCYTLLGVKTRKFTDESYGDLREYLSAEADSTTDLEYKSALEHLLRIAQLVYENCGK